MFLYLLPLQLLLYESKQKTKQNIQFQWIFVALVLVTLGQYLLMRNQSTDTRDAQFLVISSIGNCMILVVGAVILYIYNLEGRSLEDKLLYTAFAAWVIGSVVGILSIRSQIFTDFITSMFSAMNGLSFSEDTAGEIVTTIASLSGVVLFFLNWTGIVFARRFYGKQQGERYILLRRIESLNFPAYCVWIGMIALLIWILDIFIDISRPALLVLVINSVSLLLNLYFLQGMGVGIAYLRYRGLSEHSISVIMIVLVVISSFPYIGNVVVVGMWVLGIAKLWISIPKQGTNT